MLMFGWTSCAGYKHTETKYFLQGIEPKISVSTDRRTMLSGIFVFTHKGTNQGQLSCIQQLELDT